MSSSEIKVCWPPALTRATTNVQERLSQKAKAKNIQKDIIPEIVGRINYNYRGNQIKYPDKVPVS